LCLGASLVSAAPVRGGHRSPPAQVSRIQIQARNSQVIHPISGEGMILIALHDCDLSVNGEELVLRGGKFKAIRGSKALLVQALEPTSADFLVVNVRSADQALTVEASSLRGRQSLEDASDRNETLLVAISSVRPGDVWNIGAEDEWHPAKPKWISLQAREFCWVRAGLNHFENRSGGVAQFITIEW
jgi:hypothetical protein